MNPKQIDDAKKRRKQIILYLYKRGHCTTPLIVSSLQYKGIKRAYFADNPPPVSPSAVNNDVKALKSEGLVDDIEFNDIGGKGAAVKRRLVFLTTKGKRTAGSMK
jgi:hypothetical protein